MRCFSPQVRLHLFSTLTPDKRGCDAMGGKCNAAVALEAFAAAFKRAHENWGLLGYFHGVKGDDSEYFHTTQIASAACRSAHRARQRRFARNIRITRNSGIRPPVEKSKTDAAMYKQYKRLLSYVIHNRKLCSQTVLTMGVLLVRTFAFSHRYQPVEASPKFH